MSIIMTPVGQGTPTTGASHRMSSTRSHVPQLPFLLLSTLTLPCGSHAPRAGIAPVPGKTRTVLTPSDIPCLTASLRPSLSPVVRLRCPLGPTSRPLKLYRMDEASPSRSPQLKYSHWSHRNLLARRTDVCMYADQSCFVCMDRVV
jgi:hypothetical protein